MREATAVSAIPGWLTSRTTPRTVDPTSSQERRPQTSKESQRDNLSTSHWRTVDRTGKGLKMAPTDESLVQRMARGDRIALGVLYERYSADVFRVTVALLRESATASDLVHDVFLEVWRRSAQYEPSRGTVKTWIMVRARSRALDRLRSAKTKREVALDHQGGEGSVEQSVDGMNLPQALSAVSEEERAVLMLGYFEGLTCVEIGKRLDIPVGTVKSRTRTAMQKLRTFFGEGNE